jgi:hypothetical protein
VKAIAADWRTAALRLPANPLGIFDDMSAVVLRGPANTAPEHIIGPFPSMTDAEQWAREHPREDGYSLAQELTEPSDDI